MTHFVVQDFLKGKNPTQKSRKKYSNQQLVIFGE